MIRKATLNDISRIAEILVFVKRMNYRSIFQNDAVSFGEIQVLTVAEEYSNPEILGSIWVYEADGIVKGLIRIVGKEVVELYVDHFFQGQAIGSELIGFSIKERIRMRSGSMSPTDFTLPVIRHLKKALLNTK